MSDPSNQNGQQQISQTRMGGIPPIGSEPQSSNVAQATARPAKAILRCAQCLVDSHGEEAFVQHLAGKKHVRKTGRAGFAGLVPNVSGLVPALVSPLLRAEAEAFGHYPGHLADSPSSTTKSALELTPSDACPSKCPDSTHTPCFTPSSNLLMVEDSRSLIAESHNIPRKRKQPDMDKNSEPRETNTMKKQQLTPLQAKPSLKNREGLLRINFLYQAAHMYLPPAVPAVANLSRFYTSSMLEISRKLVVRMDPSMKNSLCPACSQLLVPGVTSLTQLQAGYDPKILWICSCGNKKGFCAFEKPSKQLSGRISKSSRRRKRCREKKLIKKNADSVAP